MRSEIRSKVRELIKQPDTTQISDSDINDKINDFYRNKFSLDIESKLTKDVYTISLSSTDSGKYLIPESVLKINEPMKLNGADVILTQDREDFYESFPKDTGSAFVISNLGSVLAIGTTTTKVANSAFYYEIAGYSYYKAASETVLSGSTIPQNKYGAVRLEIDADGTISIVEAAANATGYATPGKAVEGLSNESSTKAAMGYVTVINTAGTFIPGTTLLSAATVTDTYTDGFNSTRERPTTFLSYDSYLYSGPKPKDWYELVFPYTKKPDELSSDSSVPLDVQWGSAISYGTASEILLADGDTDAANEKIAIYGIYLNDIKKKFIQQQNVTRKTKARF
ncbi:MAG: hypothetical protein IMZ53_02150 [Thermoplasmata archaeon]|nr:hypothetical protein [Thermoplasmata archaeon]